jgi:hypothetical protein
MYFSLQNYPVANPLPYDDTGWTMPLMRNVTVKKVTDKSLVDQPATAIDKDVVVPGMIQGAGDVLVVENTTDNVLTTFRFKNADTKMEAAEEDFDLDGHHLRAGAFVIRNGADAKIRASVQELGLTAYATSATTVKTHPLTVPRIGYVHSWQRTQDEGWVRAALDHYGIPYTYFADQKLRDGDLRAKYDVIIFPSIGGSSVSQVNGIPKTGPDAIPYKKTKLTPNLGVGDSSDDIRGGMGIEGLAELVKFVQAGGTLITEGSTTTILPDYGITTQINVEHPGNLYAKGALMRSIIADKKSPIVYGYTGDQMPVYFSQDPVLNTRGGGFRPQVAVPGVGADITPNATPIVLSPYDSDDKVAEPTGLPSQSNDASAARQAIRQFGGPEDTSTPPRVVLQFPAKADEILLSGELAGGQALTNRALALDQPIGQGHVVMFALRPFWRWQTQGTYALGFNTIINWDHLDAGKKETKPQAASAN